MKAFFSTFALFAALASHGCATGSLVADDASLASVPRRFDIASVPLIEQTDDETCGPAAAAMALEWAGKTVSYTQLETELMTPGRNGTLQSDMVNLGRQHGVMAMPLTGLKALLAEVAEGHPVIVLQNLRVAWWPQWHYAVVTGYDLERDVVRLHAGDDTLEEVGLGRFEARWAASESWGLLLLPAGELAATRSEEEHLAAAVSLERGKQRESAQKAYEAMLRRWPASLGALVGLGNVAFAREDFTAAIDALARASRMHAAVPLVWHNLAVAYASAGESRKAAYAAKRALAIAGAREPEFRKELAAVLKGAP